MAKNPPKGSGRMGEVKDRKQAFNPHNKRFIEINMKTGKFINQKAERYTPFKGVRKHGGRGR